MACVYIRAKLCATTRRAATAKDSGVLHVAKRVPAMRTPSMTPTVPSEAKLHGAHASRCSRCRSIVFRYLWLLPILVGCILLYHTSTLIVRLFHWAERRVDRDSPAHMFFFFIITLPFHLGLPIPIVHQVWAVAIGCFFRWRAFPILIASLMVGVPLPFLIGRRLARCHGDPKATDAALRRWLPRGSAYLTPLRRAIASRPVRSSFLLMWAPLPTSSLPLLIGLLIPYSELKLGRFVAGALPSKLLHFAADVIIGIEAGSLAAALDAHDDLPGVNDLPPRHKWARFIAVGAMGLTVAFVCLMLYTMHQALKEMRQKESEALIDDLEDGSREPLLLTSPMLGNNHSHSSSRPESRHGAPSPSGVAFPEHLQRTWELTPQVTKGPYDAYSPPSPRARTVG